MGVNDLLDFRADLPTTRPTLHIALFALTVAWGIEFSQLYQADWINEIRATRIGGLLLGHGFLLSDIIVYALGVGIGALIDNRLTPR